MNSETGFSSKLRRLTALLHVCVMIRGELAIGRGTSRHTLHMREGPSRLALIDVGRQSADKISFGSWFGRIGRNRRPG